MFDLHWMLLPFVTQGMALILCISGLLISSRRGRSKIQAYLYGIFFAGGDSSILGAAACFSRSLIGSFRGLALKLNFGTDIYVRLLRYIWHGIGINVSPRTGGFVCGVCIYVDATYY